MERRLNKKVEAWTTQFKDSIREKAVDLGVIANPEVNQLLQFIFDYEHLSFEKDDLMKRRRVKNAVNLFERCCAKRATGEQCTRKKKDGIDYCGTHQKGTPHGIVEVSTGLEATAEPVEEPRVTPVTGKRKVELWAQEISGIMYYIDDHENVYQAEDVVANRCNPKVIAKYVKADDNTYHIPAFRI